MWKTMRLGDVCDFQNGFAFKSSLFKENGKPILRISNIQNEKIDTRKTVYFDAKDYDTDFSRYEVKPDDLLIAMSGATTGKIGFNKTDTTYYLNQRVGNLKPKPTLDKVFLYYLLSTKVQENLSISKGTAQPNLSSEQIKNISFSLPPLAEQQRIVAKLDAAFAEIDAAIAAADSKETEVEKLRASLLSASLSGVAVMWKTMRLGDVCEFENGDRGKNYPSKKHQVEKGIPFINAGDLSADGKITSDGMAYITNERFELLGAGKIEIDDILFCLRGSLGKCAINNSFDKGAIASSLVIIRPDKSELIPEFLLYLLKSQLTAKLIQETAGGTAQPNLSAKVVSNYELFIPPLAEQQRIVAKLDAAFANLGDAKDAVAKSKLNYQSLKSSILAQELQSEAV